MASLHFQECTEATESKAVSVCLTRVLGINVLRVAELMHVLSPCLLSKVQVLQHHQMLLL